MTRIYFDAYSNNESFDSGFIKNPHKKRVEDEFQKDNRKKNKKKRYNSERDHKRNYEDS